MVDSIKHMVNRVDVQKSRDFDSKSAASPAKGDVAIARDSVEVSEAASTQVVAQLSNKPPINTEAVSRIKSAIAEGKYPIDVDQISEALMDAYRDMKA